MSNTWHAHRSHPMLGVAIVHQQKEQECVAELLLYYSCLAGKCAQQCAPADASQPTLMTMGALACTRVTLQLGASNYAEALKLKQAMQSTGMDSLNSCWSSDSSWQLLAMEESGALTYTCYRHHSYTECLFHEAYVNGREFPAWIP